MIFWQFGEDFLFPFYQVRLRSRDMTDRAPLRLNWTVNKAGFIYIRMTFWSQTRGLRNLLELNLQLLHLSKGKCGESPYQDRDNPNKFELYPGHQQDGFEISAVFFFHGSPGDPLQRGLIPLFKIIKKPWDCVEFFL